LGELSTSCDAFVVRWSFRNMYTHRLRIITAWTSREIRPGRWQRGGRSVLRSIRLLRLFLAEQTAPEQFYSALAAHAADQLGRYALLAGQTILDVGGGAGYFTRELRTRGARCCLLEVDQLELTGHGTPPPGAVIADGCQLPVRRGQADICLSSNVLEHASDPHGLIDEMVRVTRPGGLLYLSFTNWYSPWGGHEMSPWHYLGANRAERRYVRKHGQLPKNRVGVTLFPLHIGQVLRAVRRRDDVAVVSARPRYYPRWCAFLLAIPGLREVVSWNLLLILRRAE
jgi:SAM-dependent methyltransferase